MLILRIQTKRPVRVTGQFGVKNGDEEAAISRSAASVDA